MRHRRGKQAIVNTLEQLDSEVKKLADEATPDLLPMLLKIFLKDDRPGLMTCERHTHHLFSYIRAQINLTRAKRNYYRDDWSPPCSHHRDEHALGPEIIYHGALTTRNSIQQTYRSTPCTCWVQHR